MKALLTVALLLALIPSQQADAQGGIVVGVEPAMYDTVAAGVQGWNAAGLGFVVEPSGCGTGDVTFCYSDDPYAYGGDTSWVAWYVPGGSAIYVSTVSPYPFTPAVVCHELGHWLGLHYHHADYTSCMAAPSPTTVYPNDADLAALGLSWVAAPIVTAEPAPIISLPKTGTGITISRFIGGTP